mgnify:CR=1 FL=1
MNISFVTATYRDLRVIETIQSLRMHHSLRSADIVVVDNRPDSAEGERIADFCRKAQVRYVPFTSAFGTSPARNEAIRQAENEWVVCFDCHVLFPPGFYDALVQVITWTGDRKFMFHGLLLSDLGDEVWSHFEPVFRSGSLGIWATDPRTSGAEPFEIPASGLGMFVVRKSDFVAAGGFHPLARGFGGEEVCFHEAFRRSGGSVMCAPVLRYWHNFHRTAPEHPVLLSDKLRNYLLWFRHLEWDVGRLRKHFVIGEQEPETTAAGEVCPVSESTVTPEQFDALVEIVDRELRGESPIEPTTTTTPYPFSPHTPTTRAGRRCGECQKQRSERKVAAAIKARLETLGITGERLVIVTADDVWTKVYPDAYYVTPIPQFAAARFSVQPLNVLPEPTKQRDVLVWDPPHAAAPFFELVRDQFYRWDTIVVARTGLGESTTVHLYDPRQRTYRVEQQPTILSALREWLMSTGSAYSVIVLESLEDGFIVLSRDKALTAHAEPGWAQKLTGFLKAVVEHLQTGAASVPEHVYRKRLSVCALCEYRNGHVCSACGCPIYRKALWASTRCPKGKW